MATHVVLADDHTLIRAGVRKLLEAMPGITVAGEAEDGLALLAMTAALAPDVVLVDIAMPGLNGLEATRRLLAQCPSTRVLMLSMHQNEEYVRQALRYGAAGYLLKDAAPLELEQAIGAVMRGEQYLSPAVAKGGAETAPRLRGQGADGELTARQREVLQLITEGNSTKQIARRLDLSVKTVDSHRMALMRQLGIHEVASLVRYALQHGLVSLY